MPRRSHLWVHGLVCPISLIAEGQATNSFASLRIVANGGMSYFTERLIHNTRVQEEVFLSVNNIPIDHIGFYGNRSTVVISGAASRKAHPVVPGSSISR